MGPEAHVCAQSAPVHVISVESPSGFSTNRVGAHSQVLIEHLLCSDCWAANTEVGKTDPGPLTQSSVSGVGIVMVMGNDMTVQIMITGMI